MSEQKTQKTDYGRFFMTVNPKIHRSLEKEAQKRGISIQELLRAVVIPEWLGTGESDHK